MTEKLTALKRDEVISQPTKKVVCPVCGQIINIQPDQLVGLVSCTNPECRWAFRA